MMLSMVMPAYNVNAKLRKTVENTIKEINKVTDSFEIIIINDGSTDKTESVIRKLVTSYPNFIKSFRNSKNMGKGYALRYGFTESKGDVIGFIDADGDINPDSINNLYRLFVDNKADVVVGSKNDPKSKVSSPIYRKIISKISQYTIRLLFDVNVSDTQAGIKLFKNIVIKKTMPYLRVNGYAFDVEILSFASKFGYEKMFEAPIDVSLLDSKNMNIKEMLRFIKELIKTFTELFGIFFRLNFRRS